MKGALRLGFPALVTTRGSPPSLRVTSKIKSKPKIQEQRLGDEVAGREIVRAGVGVEDAVGDFGEETQFGGEVWGQ